MKHDCCNGKPGRSALAHRQPAIRSGLAGVGLPALILAASLVAAHEVGTGAPATIREELHVVPPYQVNRDEFTRDVLQWIDRKRGS